MDSDWYKRRWFEFRNGYSFYLVFLFGFSNFILILYNLGLEHYPALKDMIPFQYFVPLMFVIVVPLSVMLGHIHHVKQLPTESKVGAIHNAYRDKIVPNSKENLQIEHALFMNGLSNWQLRHVRCQMDLMKRQMLLMNALLDKVGVSKEYRFTDYDDKQLDGLLQRLPEWEKGLLKWRNILDRFNKGESASELIK